MAQGSSHSSSGGDNTHGVNVSASGGGKVVGYNDTLNGYSSPYGAPRHEYREQQQHPMSPIVAHEDDYDYLGVARHGGRAKKESTNNSSRKGENRGSDVSSSGMNVGRSTGELNSSSSSHRQQSSSTSNKNNTPQAPTALMIMRRRSRSNSDNTASGSGGGGSRSRSLSNSSQSCAGGSSKDGTKSGGSSPRADGIAGGNGGSGVGKQDMPRMPTIAASPPPPPPEDGNGGDGNNIYSTLLAQQQQQQQTQEAAYSNMHPSYNLSMHPHSLTAGPRFNSSVSTTLAGYPIGQPTHLTHPSVTMELIARDRARWECETRRECELMNGMTGSEGSSDMYNYGNGMFDYYDSPGMGMDGLSAAGGGGGGGGGMVPPSPYRTQGNHASSAPPYPMMNYYQPPRNMTAQQQLQQLQLQQALQQEQLLLQVELQQQRYQESRRAELNDNETPSDSKKIQSPASPSRDQHRRVYQEMDWKNDRIWREDDHSRTSINGSQADHTGGAAERRNTDKISNKEMDKLSPQEYGAMLYAKSMQHGQSMARASYSSRNVGVGGFPQTIHQRPHHGLIHPPGVIPPHVVGGHRPQDRYFAGHPDSAAAVDQKETVHHHRAHHLSPKQAPVGQGQPDSPQRLSSTNNDIPNKKSVNFGTLQIRTYETILGDNPSCSAGPSLGLGWRYDPTHFSATVDDYERHQAELYGNVECRPEDLVLHRFEREAILLNTGYTRQDLAESVRGITKVKNRRRQTVHNLPVAWVEERAEACKRTFKRWMLKKNRTRHLYDEWKKSNGGNGVGGGSDGDAAARPRGGLRRSL